MYSLDIHRRDTIFSGLYSTITYYPVLSRILASDLTEQKVLFSQYNENYKKKFSEKFCLGMERTPFHDTIDLTLFIGNELGQEFSYKLWKEQIQFFNLLGPQTMPIESKIYSTFNVYNVFMQLLWNYGGLTRPFFIIHENAPSSDQEDGINYPLKQTKTKKQHELFESEEEAHRHFRGEVGISIPKKFSIETDIEIIRKLLGEKIITILIYRFGYERKTLDEVSDLYGVTRERIRQLEAKGIQKIINNFNFGHYSSFYKALDMAIAMGGEYSFSGWIEKLKESNLIDSQLNYENPYYELILVILRILCKVELPHKLPTDFRDMNISLTREMVSITLNSHLTILTINRDVERKLNHHIKKSGAINITQIRSILGPKTNEELAEILYQLGYSQLLPGWYSFATPKNDFCRSILNAAQKLIAYCPPLSAEEFYLGILNHTNRLNIPVAPLPVMLELLKKFSYELLQGVMVYTATDGIKRNLNKSEMVFLESVDQYGEVISYYELAGEFVRRKIGLGSLSNSLIKNSPLIVCIEERPRLFILRGTRPSEKKIRDARYRQVPIQQKSKILYNQNGTISFFTTVTNYSLYSGMIPALELPELKQNWKLYHSGTPTIYTVTINGGLMVGFMEYFRDFQIKAGQRIELQIHLKESEIYVSLRNPYD